VGANNDKGKTLLTFRGGHRVFGMLSQALLREKELGLMLGCGPSDLVGHVTRTFHGLKDAERAKKSLLDEMATMLGGELATQTAAEGAEGVAHLHRDDAATAQVAFLKRVATVALEHPEAHPRGAVLLTAAPGGAQTREGMFLIAGRVPEALDACAREVAAALEGKGGGKKGVFQGKSARLDLAPAALKVLRVAAAGVVGGGGRRKMARMTTALHPHTQPGAIKGESRLASPL
jgi:alanyl-tRNA synthetase